MDRLRTLSRLESLNWERPEGEEGLVGFSREGRTLARVWSVSRFLWGVTAVGTRWRRTQPRQRCMNGEGVLTIVRNTQEQRGD